MWAVCSSELYQINTAVFNTRRNSFSSYSKLDYIPNDITVTSEQGCEAIEIQYANEEKKNGGVVVTVRILEEDWNINFSGFPVNRDLDTYTELV